MNTKRKLHRCVLHNIQQLAQNLLDDGQKDLDVLYDWQDVLNGGKISHKRQHCDVVAMDREHICQR